MTYKFGLHDALSDPEQDGREWRFSFEKPWKPCLYVGRADQIRYDPRAVRCGQINTDRSGVSDHPIPLKERDTSTEKKSKPLKR